MFFSHVQLQKLQEKLYFFFFFFMSELLSSTYGIVDFNISFIKNKNKKCKIMIKSFDFSGLPLMGFI